MALYHFSAKVLSRSSRNTVQAVSYRAGCKLVDEEKDKTFITQNKDVQHVELLLPKDAPEWALEIQKLMIMDRQKGVQALVNIVEAAETRKDSQVWREYEFALHRELTKDQNMALAREFVQDQLCARGMAAQLNFHLDVDKETKEEKFHCHVIVTMRHLIEVGMGEKELDWNKKELLCDLRRQWQDYSNFHLKLNGHDVRIDHRSNKDRGIEMEPQPKRGKGIIEQEKRYDGTADSPVTDKARDYRDVQLRNLYRIVRNPEVVLDIATKHHATFMWADVQKILHRYVDEIDLFQRLEVRLQNSKELLLLRAEGKEKAIYTTRDMLKVERSLVQTAEALDKSKTHGVEERGIVKGITAANETLKEHGGLSMDQTRAIYHLTDVGQLKCVVGIAGAGKTTALKVCQDIWKDAGYAVYGLAPTGKAAQNLEREGIPSNTLHKFLKDFNEGRCQYNANSILVLDEAGMVDMERFSLLLGAVKQLGVKLVVVGDGAQLQPVEAGPAFRLVTERLGKAELHTVIRQKEDWQKHATVLFGKQETQAAIERYADRGYVHIVEEKIPSFNELFEKDDKHGIVKLYEVARRSSSLVYREMATEVGGSYALIREHQDFKRYLEWKDIEKQTARHILDNGNDFKELLEIRGLDPLKMSLLFTDKKQEKSMRYEEAKFLLQNTSLESLIGVERVRGQGVDVRQDAKQELIKAWHNSFNEEPDKASLMMAFSNRDTKNLNASARTLLKEFGHIERNEFTYTIKREEEDDFGRKRTFKENKEFSVGDRIVFTRNNRSLGVHNGSMGIIKELTKQTVQVKMEDGKNVSFAPNLNPFFDQGWAITIHKSQGTTVDQTYVLASYEMTQNLAYVSMTRHRDDVHVFGSSLDFWRPEKLPEVLSKSGEKLSAADYLDANSLSKLMAEDDHIITKIFTRMSNELEAMGAVSKVAFRKVADHFLGISRETEIRWDADHFAGQSIREEVRAEALFHPKGAQKEAPDVSQNKPHFLEAKVVEEAIIQNMASFADDIFASIGESHNPASSSATERRYGKNGHISVNLKTGAWIDYRDSSLSGGPLHLLTKIKGMSFKEALEYGASKAGISPEMRELPASQLASQEVQKERDLAKIQEDKARIEKAQALWQKGVSIEGTLAERYLREHRKIEGDLPKDLRYLPCFKDKALGDTFPCLMVGARSPTGEITGLQLTFLDPDTAGKADLSVAKKSYGVLKGSAVTISDGDCASNILFIAEGVETALSLKEAGLQGTIKATLGLSNMRHLAPENTSTHLVICADHDAPDSPAAKSLDKSVFDLQAKGYTVTVVKPEKLGDDFNDVLKTHGPQKIKEIVEKVLPQNNQLGTSAWLENYKEKYGMNKERSPFGELVQKCEQRLYDVLNNKNMTLTRERTERIPLQAERMATYIMHRHGLDGSMPTEMEMKNISLRAKYELSRLPELQRNVMNEGEKNVFRAFRIADRLATIEGRLTFEARQQGKPQPFNLPFIARRELAQHTEQRPDIARQLNEKYGISGRTAIQCADDFLRYKETHGKPPSAGQITKMIEISREVEHKDYSRLTSKRDASEIEFLRRREGDLLFKHGGSPSRDVSDALMQAQEQAKKSLETARLQQLEKERQHVNHRELSL